jgi:membrane protein
MVSKLRSLSWHDLRELFRFAVRRLDEERLPQVAGALTFTSILALVPIATIAFALFTAFPLFSTFRSSLEAYFIQNLMPANMANTILGYVNQFSSKSARLSALGGIALIITSGMTMATIDHTFNRIWRVQTSRPLLQRILVYWAIITLGPLLIGVSLSATSYVSGATTGVFGGMPMLGAGFYTLLSIVLTTAAFALLYITVPNQDVDWHDAMWGGLLAGVAFEIAKRLFAAYVIKFPTYTMIYGAVAALPIFLLWVYMLWMITLVGAVVTAVLPVMRYERWAHKPTPCSTFVDALAVLRVLYQARNRDSMMVDADEIRMQTHIGYDESQLLMEQMQAAGWVGLVKADTPPKTRWGRGGADPGKRWIMLANPSMLTLADVYRLFVFDGQTQREQELAIVKLVGQAIETALRWSLAAYFDDTPMRVPAADAALHDGGTPLQLEQAG